MHPRRLTSFVLGIRFAGGVLMALIAAADSWQADRLVDHPSTAFAVEEHLVGAANARLLFHYQAEEQRRRNYYRWEITQIALGSLFFLFLLFGTEESKITLAAALVLVALLLVQRFLLYPDIASMGRELDFLPPGTASPWRGKMEVLLGFYAGVEAVKWLIQLGMAAYWMAARRGSASEGVRNYVNPIHKTDHRHINR
jgi:hypothetical protein